MVGEVLSPSDQILKTSEIRHADPLDQPLPERVQPGLVVVAGDIAERETAVRVIDRDGRIIHEWRPVWSEVWPDGEGEFRERPVTGMYLHGVEVLPDGSMVANFEHQSTFRMDACGNILWKLDNLGHHSVHYATDGTLWVSAEDYIAEGGTGFPYHIAPLRSWTMQNISVDGQIIRSIPVIDVFLENDLEGLLHMSKMLTGAQPVTGDTLHLNDVEVFPEGQPSEVFEAGDLMMSLKHINAVLVVDPQDYAIKLLSVGGFMGQHDPDFMPNDRISVFDNRIVSLDPAFGPAASRIIEIDARTGETETILDGIEGEPFFTKIMGMHQRLDNGNILVIPSEEGRVLEFTPDGLLAWRYDNRVEEDLNRRVYMAGVLPVAMDEDFFERAVSECN